MNANEVVKWLKKNSTAETKAGMARYGIPDRNAFGVPMAVIKKYAAGIGTDHSLAFELWATGIYEAQTVSVFIADPGKLKSGEMDVWAHGFDNWAICDTACFHLFDKSPFAWKKTESWTRSKEEFVRRAAYALLWGLSVHDKDAPNAKFVKALKQIEVCEPDDRPLIKKAVNMALRAIGKRNRALNAAALRTAKALFASEDKSRSWIGAHALRELTSEKVKARFIS